MAHLQPTTSPLQLNTTTDDDQTILRHPVLTLNEKSSLGDLTVEVPPKRQRMSEHHFNESQLTSYYSLSDNERIDDRNESLEADPDQTPFTVVTYKKNRPAGIPVLFSPIKDNHSFWRVNPNTIASEIVAVIHDKITSHNINRDGSLSVRVASLEAANKLLTLTTLASIDVSVKVPDSYSRNFGKIKGIPLEYTDSELLDYLKNDGVMSVQRQVAYPRSDDGQVSPRPSTSVLLQFRPDHPIPHRVHLGFTSHVVDEYFGPPVQCLNCQRYGHIAKYCRSPKRCKVCAGQHAYKDCTSRRDPRCANCGEGHSATYSRCPRRLQASSMKKEMMVTGGPNRLPIAPPNLEFVRPPQHQRHQQRREQEPRQQPQQQQQMDQHKEQPHLPQPEIPRPFSYVNALMKTPKVTPRTESKACSGRNTTYTPSIAQPEVDSPMPVRVTHAPVNPKRRASTSASVRRPAPPQPASNNTEQLVLSMLFAALRAIVQALPSASALPEVKAFFAMEPLIASMNAQKSGNLKTKGRGSAFLTKRLRGKAEYEFPY